MTALATCRAVTYVATTKRLLAVFLLLAVPFRMHHALAKRANGRHEIRLFHTSDNRYPNNPRSPEQFLVEIRDQAVLAEKLGLNSAWIGEHHFNRRGCVSVPAVVLANVAAATTCLRLGPAVVVLPIHHPIHVPEEWATLDQLSGGRIDFAAGRGYINPWPLLRCEECGHLRSSPQLVLGAAAPLRGGKKRRLIRRDYRMHRQVGACETVLGPISRVNWCRLFARAR